MTTRPTTATDPSLLVPVALDALVLRDSPAGMTGNALFTTPATAPGSATGPGATAQAAAEGWELVNDPASASGTVTSSELLAAGPGQPGRLHVSTSGPGCGIRQRVASPDGGPPQAIATVRVLVLRGRVGIAAGTGRRLRVDGQSSGTGDWHQLRTLSSSAPVNEIRVVATSAEGAEFWVAEATLRPLQTGNLLDNASFAEPMQTSAPVTGPAGAGASAAPGWQVRNGPSAAATASTASSAVPSARRPGGQMLLVTTNAAGGGLVQQFLADETGPPGASATVWVFVTRGSVGLACGSAGDVRPGATTDALQTWVALQTQNTLPAGDGRAATLANQVAVVAATAGGADFSVDSAVVVQAGRDNLLTNPAFTQAAAGQPNPTSLTGRSTGGLTPSAGWTTWVNPQATISVAREPSDRPGSTGDMLHVTADNSGCGIVQTFLPHSDTGPDRITASAWVRTVRGGVCIGTGNGGDTGADTSTETAGQWQLIEAANGVSPANEFIIYAATDGGAEYYVDSPAVSWSRPAQWAACRMDRPQQPAGDGSNALQQLLPPPFADRPDDRPAGAYLHWALPDGLTRPQPAGAGTYPALPDRWLVARLAPGSARPARRAGVDPRRRRHVRHRPARRTTDRHPAGRLGRAGRRRPAVRSADGARLRRPGVGSPLRQRREPAGVLRPAV